MDENLDDRRKGGGFDDTRTELIAIAVAVACLLAAGIPFVRWLLD